ncbi:MAG: hypothetical protein ACSLEM_06490 [Candidatus Malihini olakiniferum]
MRAPSPEVELTLMVAITGAVVGMRNCNSLIFRPRSEVGYIVFIIPL